jgi:hypothetical protein
MSGDRLSQAAGGPLAALVLALTAGGGRARTPIYIHKPKAGHLSRKDRSRLAETLGASLHESRSGKRRSFLYARGLQICYNK